MVIDAPQRPSILPTPAITTTTPTHDKKKKQQFTIRRTHPSDLNAISTMLAMESVGIVQKSSSSQDNVSSSLNWNYNMKYLRAKSQLEEQLTHRLAAVEEGRCTVHRMMLHDDIDKNNDNNDLCYLWSTSNKLRTKIQTAVLNSNEENAWTTHNFDTTPTIDMLNHIMISVEEVSSGNIVGFCEVACLPCPNNDKTMQQQMTEKGNDDDGDDSRIKVSDSSLDIPSSNCEETSDSYCDILQQEADEDEDFLQSFTNHYSPAIVNLVTSSTHRRMGIASRIISFAKRYTATQWKTTSCVKTYNNNNIDDNNGISLGLYVHPENEHALRLYTKNGFAVVPTSVSKAQDKEDEGLLYLSHRGQDERKDSHQI